MRVSKHIQRCKASASSVIEELFPAMVFFLSVTTIIRLSGVKQNKFNSHVVGFFLRIPSREIIRY